MFFFRNPANVETAWVNIFREVYSYCLFILDSSSIITDHIFLCRKEVGTYLNKIIQVCYPRMLLRDTEKSSSTRNISAFLRNWRQVNTITHNIMFGV